MYGNYISITENSTSAIIFICPNFSSLQLFFSFDHLTCNQFLKMTLPLFFSLDILESVIQDR